MKMQKRTIYFILSAAVLLTLMTLFSGALADSPLGVATGAKYSSISLSSSTNAATVLDWLDDYLETELTPSLMLAGDLADYSDKIEQNKAMMNVANDTQIAAWLAAYNAVPNGGTLTARELAVRTERELFEVQREMEFYELKLTEYLVQDMDLREQITSGYCTPEEMDQLMDELTIVDREAEKYRVAALKKLMGNDALTETASRARTQLSAFSASNPYRAAVTSIQGLGSYIERRQAATLSRTENGGDLPHITVASDKEVIICIIDPDSAGSLTPVGVQGIAVTMQAERSPGVLDPNKKQTIITDEDGLAIFEVTNFNADADRYINVHLSIEDVRQRENVTTVYQRRNFGLMHLHGGNTFNIYAEVDDGSPYLVSLQFEDLDMTVMDEGMYISANNSTVYNVHGEVEMNGFTDSVHVRMVDAPEGVPDQVLFDEIVHPGSDCTFSVKSQWLNKTPPAGSPAFREDQQLSVEIYPATVSANGSWSDWHKSWFPSFHKVASDEWLDTLLPMDEPGVDSGTFLNKYVGFLGVKIPGDVPVLGGTEINIRGILDMNLRNGFWEEHKHLARLKVQYDFPNKVLLAYNYKLIDPKKDSGWNAGRVYVSDSLQASLDREKSVEDSNSKMANKFKQGIKDAETVQQNGNYARTFTFDASIYMNGVLTIVDMGDEYKLTGTVIPGVILDVVYDWTWYAGYPCVFVNVNFSLRFTIAPTIGIQVFANGLDWHDFGLSPSTYLEVGIHFELRLSLNFGVKGVICGGVRGAGWLDFTLRHGKTDTPTIKVGARLELFIDSFFFNWHNIFIEVYKVWTDTDELPAPASVPDSSSVSLKASNGGNVGTPVFDSVVCQPDDMKLVQDNRSRLFCFWVDRSVKPNTLNVHLVEGHYENDETKFPDQVIFTVPERWNYLYDFDVSFDENFNELDEYGYGHTGFYFVATMGNWEGGVNLQPSQAQTGDAGYRQFVYDLCTHTAGATYFGTAMVSTSGPGFGVASAPMHFMTYLDDDTVLFQPQIERIDFIPNSLVGYQKRMHTFTIAGILPYLNSHQNNRAEYMLLQYKMDTTKGVGTFPHPTPCEEELILEGVLVGKIANGTEANSTAEEYLPEYWLMPDSHYTKGIGIHEGEITGNNLMLIHRSYPVGDDVLQYVSRFGVSEVYLPRGVHTVTQISNPIHTRETQDAYGRPIDKRYDHFLISFLQEVEPEEGEDPEMSYKSCRAILTLENNANKQGKERSPDYYDIYCYCSVYDLIGGNGTANALFIPDQAAFYFYWFETHPSVEDPDVGVVDIVACQYDSSRRVISPRFVMATLPEADCIAREFVCLRDKNGNTVKLVGVYNDETGMLKKQTIQLKTAPSILSCAPDVLAVGSGYGFNMYARIENTGAIVLQKVTYALRAENVDTGASSIWQTATIDLRYPFLSNIVHYDYLQQDHPELQGKSLNELDAALERMNDSQYVSTGEHTIFRVADNHDGLNQNIQHVTTYTMQGDETVVSNSTNESYFFMPGNVATYQTAISGGATAGMAGKYTLRMGINSVNFSLGMTEDAPVYQAVLSDDGTRFDYYLLDENSDQIRAANSDDDSILALFAPDLPDKVVENGTQTNKTGLNTARNETLTHGHERYLTMEQNDYELNARIYTVKGVQYVDFSMSNEAPAVAPDGAARLIAKAKKAGQETPTGWSTTLPQTNIKDGFGRGITVPLKDIVNGKSFEEMNVYLVTAASDDPLDFMDTNGHNNKVTLHIDNPFRILRQPENTVANENTDATFSFLVANGENYGYQWAVLCPDGVERPLEGETAPTLVVHNAQLNQSGYFLACYVTNADGRTVRSNYAKLTVVQMPLTGDSVNPYIFAAVAALCLAAVVVLLKKNRSAKS